MFWGIRRSIAGRRTLTEWGLLVLRSLAELGPLAGFVLRSLAELVLVSLQDLRLGLLQGLDGAGR